ncbi:MAG: GNAT family N-acetyltransferase [Candidatus Poribacteria bacterium]|nr:GNAT family N-acetyltransferase [Candidatus Poribacteria bacterium]MDE0019037.1 GNAT family N-acetyltransferase [Candidatus Poribacteria bacterium]
MEIVKAKLSDVERLAELNRCLIEDERHPNPMNIPELTERMNAWLATDYICYLAKESRHIIAYCLYRDDGKYYYMRQLYVDRSHRRKGIATQLLDWLYENVWTDKKVRLDVLVHNEDAVAFYKRYGFRIGVYRMEK